MVRMAIRSHQKLVAGGMYMDRWYLCELSVLPIPPLLTFVEIGPITHSQIRLVDHSSSQDFYPYRQQ